MMPKKLPDEELLLREATGERMARAALVCQTLADAQRKLWNQDRTFTLDENYDGILIFLSAYLRCAKDIVPPNRWPTVREEWKAKVVQLFESLDQKNKSSKNIH